MRNRPIKLRKQLTDKIRDKYKLGYGKAKHEIKDKHNATDVIHSEKTYKTYRQHVNQYADYCKKKGIKTYEEAEKRVPEYMQYLEEQKGYSASSLYTALCGLAKCFDKHTTEIDYKAPERSRSDIVRSRTPAQRDKNFSAENNKPLIDFCESTGLRRDEVAHVNGSDLVLEHGKAYLKINKGTKGGKERKVEIIGNRQHVINMCKTAGHGKVFAKVNSNADIHSYRGNYACALYKKYARPLEQIPKEDRYCCRGDMKGVILDKKAMKIASENLGHNRISVIASNYLYDLD